MNKRRFFIAMLTTLALVPGLGVAATIVQAGTLNTTWSRAEALGTNPTTAELFGRLDGTGDARYFTFLMTHSGNMHVTVVTTPDAQQVEPRIVMYEPELYTIGPALPMPQPPSTLATVYPANAKSLHHEGPLMTEVATRGDHVVDLPRPGKYYLAVYNAGRDAGAFRIELATSGHSAIGMSERMRAWWLTNTWIGPQYTALFIPLTVAVIAVLVWLGLHRFPHPASVKVKPGRKKRTVTRGKVS